MITLLIQLIKELSQPYDRGILPLGLYVWQYVAILLLVLSSVAFTWFILHLVKKAFYITDIHLQIFAKFKYRAYYLASIGAFLHAKSSLELPLTAFWQNTTLVLFALFAIMSLLVVNKFIDLIFSLMSRKMEQANSKEAGILQLLKGITKFAVLSTTFLLVLGAFLGSRPISLLKSVSIGAGTLTAVVAFASKDMISNLFGALVVTIGRPFRIKDWIVVNNLEGRVISISMRATKLQTAAGTMIYVPNSTFITKHISNYGKTVYVPIVMQMHLMDANEKDLADFLEAFDQLIKEYPPLKSKQCRIEMQNVGIQKARLTLHLFFEKISEANKIKYLRSFIANVMSLAKTKKITLES